MSDDRRGQGVVVSDSADFSHTFYGILNKQGQFWTPLAFQDEDTAREHIIAFWGLNTESRDKCLTTHKIVPVRIRLETISEGQP